MTDDNDPTEGTGSTTPDTPHRAHPDLFTLIAGIGALLVSAYLVTDGASWLPAIDPRWLLAGSALLVGVLMLAASLRRGRDG